MTQDEWGPWIEHDASPCPVPAWTFAEVEFWGLMKNGGVPYIKGGVITPARQNAPDWTVGHPADDQCTMIIRYRIRKPRGMTVLESMLADLPEKVDT